MNTTQLKRFAAEARNKLREGVKGRLIRLGFSLGSQTSMPDNADLLLQPGIKHPEIVDGGGLWKGRHVSTAFVHNWNQLYNHVKQIGIKQMIEEGAYTWFNRLVAIRILSKNNLCDAVLQYVDSARTPRIVDEARQKLTYSEYLIVNNGDGEGQHSVLNLNLFGQTYKLYDISYKLFEEDSLVTEQFAVLINAWVNNNPIISTCFDADSKHFMELLLPDDIRNEGGFLDMLNSTDFITDEDYRSPELIGWLYQFYISERKDEVFAKKGKYDADEIAPATQIFTPNWIVKYMVQNTVGRIYLDSLGGQASLPDIDKFKAKWKYLVEPSESEKNDRQGCLFSQLEDLKVADLACGSGHILNECFDLLYELYIHEGYSRREAVTNIFEHNLTGIDIDLRAKQLATFALLLKACQRDSSFADAHCLPKVLCTSESLGGQASLPVAVNDAPQQVRKELTAAFALMENADTLGSIMKFDLSPETRQWLKDQIACTPTYSLLTNTYNLLLALTEKYDAIVMNPPYMGGGNMNVTLSNYVKANYPAGKADLATVFVEMSPQHLVDKGKYAFIIPPSWMFLSGFETLRRGIIDNQSIDSLLHLSRGVFGADFGSSSAVISNEKKYNATGNYFRLIERTFQEFDQKHLRMLFEKTLENQYFRYKFIDYSKDVEEIEYSEEGAIIYYPNIPQSNFEKIPGSPIGYWVSEKVILNFSKTIISNVCDPRSGLSTSDNNRFIRHWFEVNTTRINWQNESLDESIGHTYRWYPIQRGGGFRKWYGLNIDVINWENNGEEIKAYASALYKSYTRTIKNIPFYFKPGISWSYITSGKTSFRTFGKGYIFINAGPACVNFEEHNNSKNYIQGLLNSKVAHIYLSFLAPTVNFDAGPIGNVPYIMDIEQSNPIELLVTSSNGISKADWDAHETSWDFQENEIVALAQRGLSLGGQASLPDFSSPDFSSPDFSSPDFSSPDFSPPDFSSPDFSSPDFSSPDFSSPDFSTGKDACPPSDSIERITSLYKQKWEKLFFQLHANEEELNRRFIEIYGLQDELTPDVPLNEVTILQQGEISLGGQASLPDITQIEQSRRHLPHWEQDSSIQFVTFRLADSLPQSVLAEYKEAKATWLGQHPEPWSEDTEREFHSKFSYKMDEYLDNGLGSCVLQNNQVADILESTIKFQDGKKCRLIGYVIMPNHVHMLLQLMPGVKLSSVLHSIKSFSANEINKSVGREGKLWMEESFDRMIRNEEHYNNVIKYIWKNYYSGGVRVYDRQGCLSSQIVWHDDVLMKQLISYAVGCMMGRYRLDRPGLAVAHPNATPAELAEYNLYLITYNLCMGEDNSWQRPDAETVKKINDNKEKAELLPDGTYKLYDIRYKIVDRCAIDEDAIIPLMPADCGFYDNATQRMSDFVRQVFGTDTQTENLNYIEKCLGKSIEQYFIKDFWKDHKKMYQNRPIYWLFSSKKGAFQVITYMHRMTPYTVERIRAKYLLPYIETLTNRIAELQSREDVLSTADSRRLDSLQKQLEECREYHDRLAVVAERAIGFDLDDGVIHNYALYGDILAKLK